VRIWLRDKFWQFSISTLGFGMPAPCGVPQLLYLISECNLGVGMRCIATIGVGFQSGCTFDHSVGDWCRSFWTCGIGVGTVGVGVWLCGTESTDTSSPDSELCRRCITWLSRGFFFARYQILVTVRTLGVEIPVSCLIAFWRSCVLY
jgi:hypothetical protein